MSRDPDGRYGYGGAQLAAGPVAVTCHGCGRKTDGPLWRGTIAVPSGREAFGVSLCDDIPAVLCEDCARAHNTAGVRRCASCGRHVAHGGPGTRPHRYCTPQCQQAARTRRRREQRFAGRQRRCGHCRKAFAATRRDAEWCSGACRQAAYRKRAADQAAEREYAGAAGRL